MKQDFRFITYYFISRQQYYQDNECMAVLVLILLNVFPNRQEPTTFKCTYEALLESREKEME